MQKASPLDNESVWVGSVVRATDANGAHLACKTFVRTPGRPPWLAMEVLLIVCARLCVWRPCYHLLSPRRHLEVWLRVHSPVIRLFISFVVLLPWTGAQAQEFPVIGAEVSAYLVRTRSETKQCESGTTHHDPCATVNIRGHRVTVAWDQTKAVTYLFTDDRRLVGDSELSVRGSCRVAGDSGRGDSRLIKYRQWLVTEDWGERFSKWSGEATWYAALHVHSEKPGYATIVGFVQSRYRKPH